MAAEGDRLSDLPDEILVHILCKLPDIGQVARTSELSTRWRFLWMSVPVSLRFNFSGRDSEKDILDYMVYIHRKIFYWSRSLNKIRTFRVLSCRYQEHYAKDVNLWVYFATKVANVEDFTLQFLGSQPNYEFPQFAYSNTRLRNLSLSECQLNPCGSVNWSGLISLSLKQLTLRDGVMEKVLSGCPNLECLKLHSIRGIHRLEISSVKLTDLVIGYYDKNYSLRLELLAPYLEYLQLEGLFYEISIQQKNVASLVTAVLLLEFTLDDKKECRYMKKLLHGVAHVKNLQLSPDCIEIVSMLALRGWQSPPSTRKFLQLAGPFGQSDLPGICSFLQSSPDLETLFIDWKEHYPRVSDEDEQSTRFETHNYNRSFLSLKTIEIDFEPPTGNKFFLQFVKYLLKNAIVLEKFVIYASLGEGDKSWDYVTMTQELGIFPRSSPHASIAIFIGRSC